MGNHSLELEGRVCFHGGLRWYLCLALAWIDPAPLHCTPFRLLAIHIASWMCLIFPGFTPATNICWIVNLMSVIDVHLCNAILASVANTAAILKSNLGLVKFIGFLASPDSLLATALLPIPRTLLQRSTLFFSHLVHTCIFDALAEGVLATTSVVGPIGITSLILDADN